MTKWKCDICNKDFDNFQAQGFDNKIYCPLCYYKELYNRQNKALKDIKEYVENHELLNGKYTTYFEDFTETDYILDIINKALGDK